MNGAGGGGSRAEFKLAAGNASPRGLAYVDSGKGSLYVGDDGRPDQGGEIVYRYSLGGLLLGGYHVPNPMPVQGNKDRAKITALTECGGLLAVVWHRTFDNQEAGRHGVDCQVSWLSLDETGNASTNGVQTSDLGTNSVPLTAASVGPAVCPSWPNPTPANGPVFAVIRGLNFWWYAAHADPVSEVAGARDGRMRPAASGAGIRGTSVTEIRGVAPFAVATSTAGFTAAPCVISGAAGIWPLYANAAITAGYVRSGGARWPSDAALADTFTAAMATSTTGMSGHGGTRRVFTVHSDGRLRTLVL